MCMGASRLPSRVSYAFVPASTVPGFEIALFVRQQRGRCWLHAFNHGAQQRLRPPSPVNACIVRGGDQPSLDSGNYDWVEIGDALRSLSSGTLSLAAGIAHHGLSDGRSWQQTLAQQPPAARACPFSILLTHAGPPARCHALCAIRRQFSGRPAAYYLLNSCKPGRVVKLGEPLLDLAFNAAVYTCALLARTATQCACQPAATSLACCAPALIPRPQGRRLPRLGLAARRPPEAAGRK